MANLKISELTELAEQPADDDKIEIVDVSDTTMAASGTNKWVSFLNAVKNFFNTTTGHDHDGTDSKKVIATNLDVTGLTASKPVRVNASGTALETVTNLPITEGGTGASDADTARTNLGLGTIATQDANAVAITGGSITGITDLAIADGGTGASTAAAARANLLPSYATNSLKVLRVNSSETDVEWAAVSASASPGGSNTQLQYNNAGAFGGTDGATWDDANDAIKADQLVRNTQTLTDGATINWDASLGAVASVTLGGNRTFNAPTSLVAGGAYILHVIQDATGGRTLTWNSVFKWPGGVAPVLTSTPGARDVFSFISDGTNLYATGFVADVK